MFSTCSLSERLSNSNAMQYLKNYHSRPCYCYSRKNPGICFFFSNYYGVLQYFLFLFQKSYDYFMKFGTFFKTVDKNIAEYFIKKIAKAIW